MEEIKTARGRQNIKNSTNNLNQKKKKHDLALTLTNYKSPQANDIAIITLKKALKWTDNVGPICLPPSVNFEDRVAVVTGWGTLEYRE